MFRDARASASRKGGTRSAASRYPTTPVRSRLSSVEVDGRRFIRAAIRRGGSGRRGPAKSKAEVSPDRSMPSYVAAWPRRARAQVVVHACARILWALRVWGGRTGASGDLRARGQGW